jgi:hypothetical protein
MNVAALSQFDDIRMDMTVLRSVPCSEHEEWTEGCPDCLTGEQARLLGVTQETEERHVRWTRKEGRWQRLASSFSRS